MEEFRDTCVRCGESLDSLKFNGYYFGDRQLEDVYFYVDVPENLDEVDEDNFRVSGEDYNYFKQFSDEYWFGKFTDVWHSSDEPHSLDLECGNCGKPLELMPPEYPKGSIHVFPDFESNQVVVCIEDVDIFEFRPEEVDKYKELFEDEVEASHPDWEGKPVPEVMELARKKLDKY